MEAIVIIAGLMVIVWLGVKFLGLCSFQWIVHYKARHHVALSTVGRFHVSTVLVLYRYETMVFDRNWKERMAVSYDTLREAKHGHDRVVNLLACGTPLRLIERTMPTNYDGG